jgi:hypothetical protein
MLRHSETPIITKIEHIQRGGTPPLGNTLPFFAVTAEAGSETLDLRISEKAAPRLAESIMTVTRDVVVDARTVDVHLDQSGGKAMLTIVSPTHALSMTIPRAGLESLRSRIASLLS